MWEKQDQQQYNKLTSSKIGQVYNDDFYDEIKSYAMNKSYNKYLEIGTWNGLGSTKAFVDGFETRDDNNYIFYSLECNKEKWNDASKLYSKNERIHILNEVIWNEQPNDFYEIFPQCLTNENFKHWNEVDITNMKDCKLFLDRQDLPSHFDVVLLDGGEFTTYHEFKILENKTKILMLDDINVDKCKLIVKEIEASNDWMIVKKSETRNGFLIAKNLIISD